MLEGVTRVAGLHDLQSRLPEMTRGDGAYSNHNRRLPPSKALHPPVHVPAETRSTEPTTSGVSLSPEGPAWILGHLKMPFDGAPCKYTPRPIPRVRKRATWRRCAHPRSPGPPARCSRRRDVRIGPSAHARFDGRSARPPRVGRGRARTPRPNVVVELEDDGAIRHWLCSGSHDLSIGVEDPSRSPSLTDTEPTDGRSGAIRAAAAVWAARRHRW